MAAFEDREVIQDSVDPEVADGITPTERIVLVVVPILLEGIPEGLGLGRVLDPPMQRWSRREVETPLQW